MRELYRLLLEKLEEIGTEYPSLYDSIVREIMSRVLMDGFARMKPDYEPTSQYCMSSDEGNRLVATAVRDFLTQARIRVAKSGLHTFYDRLRLLQDDTIQTDHGRYPDDFFGGYIDPEEFDSDGNYVG